MYCCWQALTAPASCSLALSTSTQTTPGCREAGGLLWISTGQPSSAHNPSEELLPGPGRAKESVVEVQVSSLTYAQHLLPLSLSVQPCLTLLADCRWTPAAIRACCWTGC